MRGKLSWELQFPKLLFAGVDCSWIYVAVDGHVL